MAFSFFARLAGHVHICGHRGHSVGAPENTIAAFKAVHDLGGTTCEIDTVLTKDNEIVVLHDLLVDRTTNGSGAARDMTAAEIASLDAGSWFGAQFSGERVPTLRQVLTLARELNLGFEIEIKEKRDPDAYINALERVLANPADRERVMMISFDHLNLKTLKAAIPDIKTGGIVQQRFSDPVAIARASNLDELCIDLSVYNLDDAKALHAAGISIRCHAYDPQAIERAVRAGLDWPEVLASGLRNGLVDTISGDDVAWLQNFANEAQR